MDVDDVCPISTTWNNDEEAPSFAHPQFVAKKPTQHHQQGQGSEAENKKNNCLWEEMHKNKN